MAGNTSSNSKAQPKQQPITANPLKVECIPTNNPREVDWSVVK